MKKIHILMAAMLLSMTMQAQTPQDLRDSLSKATNELAYHPDSISLRLKKACWNIRLQQWEYAKDDLDKVLYQNPKNIAGLFYRAFVNDKLMRFNFARLDYQNLLVLIPGNFEAQLGLSHLNQKDKHYTEDYDGINMLVEQYPDSAEAWAARAGIEKERNMLETAVYDYSKAHELDSKNIDYITNMLDIHITLKESEAALDDINKLTKLGVKPGALREFRDRLKKIKK